jgi:hypothetical protein
MNTQPERIYCNMYFRIRQKYQEHYKRIEPMEWCMTFNEMIHRLPLAQATAIATAVYVMMLQHERLSSAMPRDVAYGGMAVGNEHHFQFSAIPPALQQFIRILIEEISTNSAPEQIF